MKTRLHWLYREKFKLKLEDVDSDVQTIIRLKIRPHLDDFRGMITHYFLRKIMVSFLILFVMNNIMIMFNAGDIE